MRETMVYILWDASHIWGLMALRAMRSFGLRCRLVKSIDIAQSDILGKHGKDALLLVPGGNARQKAMALGDAGRKNICRWLAQGNRYAGFCGGAGLALTQENAEDGLNICAWRRAPYQKRIYHLLSGHVWATLSDGNTVRLPVWWPGRFWDLPDSRVEILARYHAPADDTWLADLPLPNIPDKILSHWQKEGSLDERLGFPARQPLAIRGRYGRGEYFLSYAHAETPGSPQANIWLCHILARLCGFGIVNTAVPQWVTCPGTADNYNGSPSPIKIQGDFLYLMRQAHASVCRLARLGADLGLLFNRKPWLWGWQSGFAGMACNNLLAALSCFGDLGGDPGDPPDWKKKAGAFAEKFNYFIVQAEQFFWDYRLRGALSASATENMKKGLAETQCRLFGHPMHGGGLIQDILDMVENYIPVFQDHIFARLSED